MAACSADIRCTYVEVEAVLLERVVAGGQHFSERRWGSYGGRRI